MTHLTRFAALRRELLAARRAGATRWGPDFVDLSRSEPLQAWPPDDVAAAALAAQRTRRYPAVGGDAVVLADIAEYYSRELGIPLGRENLLLTSGALTALTVAVMATTKPGDEIAIPSPHYHATPSQVESVGRRPRLVDTSPQNGWRLVDPGAAAALILVNPANPTTTSYNAQQLKEVVEAMPPAAALIADEVYADYVYQPADFASVATVSARDNWLVIRSAAKTIGRPGLRVGVLIGPARLIEIATDIAAATTGAASVPAQFAFRAGLELARDHIRPYRRRVGSALEIAARQRLSVSPPAGTYYLWLGGERLGRAETAARLAVDHGVFVWPGEYFGAGDYARVSLSVPLAALTTGLTRIGQGR